MNTILCKEHRTEPHIYDRQKRFVCGPTGEFYSKEEGLQVLLELRRIPPQELTAFFVDITI
jgi:hypothetical protein